MAHYKGGTSDQRVLQLKREREHMLQESDFKKQKIAEGKAVEIEGKFTSHVDSVEAAISSSTAGLLTLKQMQEKHQNAYEEQQRQIAKSSENAAKLANDQRAVNKEKQKLEIKKLTFAFDDDEEEDEEDDDDDWKNDKPKAKDKEVEQDEKEEEQDKKEDEQDKKDDKEIAKDEDKETDNKEAEDKDKDNGEDKDEDKNEDKDEDKNEDKDEDNNKHQESTTKTLQLKKKPMKCPEVDTSYLPDREREAEDRRIREELRKDWVKRQEAMKEEEIEITFSYWDGAGHRKALRMKKGNTIYQFLGKALEMCRNEFHELRTATTDQLMYIKEDIILPQDSSFYDFIISKARGKSGPLFNFDVHDDVRMLADATVERDESHAGKVLLRSWYKKNKHIFPCNRWEPYDPHKTYEKYTISDKVKN